MNTWGQVIVSNLFVASLIGCLAALVGRTGRRASLAHWLWLVFFVKLITPPIISLPIIERPQWMNSVGSLDSWYWLLLVWGLGFVLFVVFGLIRFIRFYALLRRAGQLDSDSTAFVQSLVRSEASHSSSAVCPKVLRLPMRVSPMLFGFGRRAVIVCPNQLWQELSESQRQAFLAHETAHFCRRDHWIRWLEWLVTAAYWWFPGVHIARGQLERHEEACCDAWAVRKLNTTPRQYGEALLRVVDFISEHRVGVPRLASAMQPTESLAERLKLLMRGRDCDDSSASMKYAASVTCIAMLVVHPIATARQESTYNLRLSSGDRVDASDHAAILLDESPRDDSGDLPLPQMPRGFWNRAPESCWASDELCLPGAKLVADAKAGILIDIPGREPLVFSRGELTAIIDIPSTQRVVIGDSNGRLRLWDLAAGTAVSLIGVHPAAVSSLAYHDSAGLVSADESGSAVRWDLQSGQRLASWSAESSPLQSIRYSADGQTLAILLGVWDRPSDSRRLEIVESHTLKSIRSLIVPTHTAIVVDLPQYGWCTIDWTGAVRCLGSTKVVSTIPKHRVSALLLSQAANFDSLNFRIQ